ncbi:MAG: ABC transporter permease subunit [Anaerolineae bacterium]|nr:ABC transporter permease subunit [Anaerolineae bacterium]MDW8171249.1 ABC transporter permease subunit [Anaerolineae bacterium]
MTATPFISAPSIKDKPKRRSLLPSFLRNTRVLGVLSQIIFVFVFLSLLSLLWSNISSTLAARNLTPGFAFLETRAGFNISESPSWYSAERTYREAFTVGVINTLRVVSVGLVLATVIGVLLGIALLANNWLIRTISKTYVEILRNTPLLVQLFFWYFVVILGLPSEDIRLPAEGILVLSLRLPAHLMSWIVIGAWQARQQQQGMLSAALLTSLALEAALAVVGYSDGLVLLAAAGGVALWAWAWRDQRWPLIAAGSVLVVQGLAVILGSLLPNGGLWWTEVHSAIFVSKQAFVFPEFLGTANFAPWALAVLLSAAVAWVVYRLLAARQELTGQPNPRGPIALAIVGSTALIAWTLLAAQPGPEIIVIGGTEKTVEQARADGDINVLAREAEISTLPIVAGLPQKPRFRFTVGSVVSPEYMALLVGLVVYTSAFIGEIVRAGIQAVPYGQIEASRALGLNGAQTLRLVVLPQALRVIIPPLGNQYLNLSKNSSLAAAVAFADTYQVGQTMMNQSGQSVTGFTMILVTYLTMSLIISLFMNLVNRRFQLATR